MSIEPMHSAFLIQKELMPRRVMDITLYTNSLLGGDTAMISQTITGALAEKIAASNDRPQYRGDRAIPDQL
jgi:hypothetical protein